MQEDSRGRREGNKRRLFGGCQSIASIVVRGKSSLCDGTGGERGGENCSLD